MYVCRLLVHSECEHSFYILIQNTVAAALAFEMLHNQVETWALERKSELKGRTARNSYCIGVVERVLRDAQKENCQALKKAEEDEKKRVEEEAAARAAEISRLAIPVLSEPEPEVGEEKSKVRIEDIPEKDVRNPSLLDGPGSGVLFHSLNLPYYTHLFHQMILATTTAYFPVQFMMKELLPTTMTTTTTTKWAYTLTLTTGMKGRMTSTSTHSNRK